MGLNTALYQNPPLITVFGGSGFVGRHVVEALTKRGYRVRIAVRNPQKAYYILQMGGVGQIQMIAADITNRSHVARALAGANAAISLAGMLTPLGKNTLAKVHVKGAKNVADLAAKAKIPLLHMSSLWSNKDSNLAYAKTKGLGEEAVRIAYPDAIIIRPSLIFGPEDRFFNRLAAQAQGARIITLFGANKARFQPVYVGDIASFIVKALEGEAKAGTIYELGGPETVTLQALFQKILTIIQQKPRLITLPVWMGRIIGSFFSLVGKLPLIPTKTTREQILLLQLDSCVTLQAQNESRTFEALGITPTPIAAIAPSYLWRFRPNGQFATLALSTYQKDI
ncbi:complex I NDUFA9 subunit family protein [Bartonella sp. DGB2]|uniref:complex I NDUFA9 subunit family protein n=1 Tax=Bartonella sp. DGB2 TaxID=3388426 RepID=UPI003990134F